MSGIQFLRRDIARTRFITTESGQNWPLIILAAVLAILEVGIVAAGSAVFMFRQRIAKELVAATVAPRTTEETATLVPRRTEEAEGKKETETKREGNKQRSQARPRPMTPEEAIPMGWRTLQGSW
jgi:hypothetical protein